MQEQINQFNDIVTQETQDKTFLDTNVNKLVIDSLNKQNFVRPTPIQYKSIPKGIQSINILAEAKAGTGKTIAFLSILLDKIINIKQIQTKEQIQQKNSFPLAMIILPTRELALQVFDVLFKILKVMNKQIKTFQIKSYIFIGGLPIQDDKMNLQNDSIDIIVGTVGRINELINKDCLSLANLEILILDEVDKLFYQSESYNQINNNIIKPLKQNKKKFQFLGFSATYTTEIIQKISENIENYEFISVITENQIQQQSSGQQESQMLEEGEIIEKDKNLDLQKLFQYYAVLQKENQKSIYQQKIQNIISFLKKLSFKQCIIFYNDKIRGQNLLTDLSGEGFSPLLIHGDQSQAERIRTMNQIRRNKINIIISTDLLSRGIDIFEIDLVINFDVPKDIETYRHRIGRTSRYGKYGVSILYLTEKEQSFIEQNQTLFKNISQIPENIDFLNQKLSEKYQEQQIQNKMIQNQENNNNKQQQQYEYHNQFLIDSSAWKQSDYTFYDESRFQFFDEEKAKQEEGESEEVIIKENLINEYLEINNHEHGDNNQKEEEEFSFLNCKICYEFLRQSQNIQQKQFQILQYFNEQFLNN